MIRKVKLGDICDLSIGFVGTVTTQYEEGGIPFLRTLNIKPYKIIGNDLKRITKEFHQSQKKSILRTGDIVMVHTGVPGICCVISDEYDNSNCIDMIVIKPHNDMVNSHYLAAYMNTIGYRHIEKLQVGCIQKHFNLKDAIELEIYLPDIKSQNAIGTLVEFINAKLENNNLINVELEAMARTIYDYWFLQFDFPDENGKPYKSSGGKMVWNEELKKEIPDGWRIGTLNQYIVRDKGGDWGKEKTEGNYTRKVACLRGADFPAITGTATLTVPRRFILEKNTDKFLESGDLIIEISGGSPTQSTGRICYINDSLLERFDTDVITSNFCKAISLKNIAYMYWFYVQWKKIYESNILFKYEGKTTGIKNLLFDIFIKDYKFVQPPDELIFEYNEKVADIFEKIQKNQKESQELASLRDFLLPLLMNGQVGFREC